MPEEIPCFTHAPISPSLVVPRVAIGKGHKLRVAQSKRNSCPTVLRPEVRYQITFFLEGPEGGSMT